MTDEFKVSIFNHSLVLMTKLTGTWSNLKSIRPLCGLTDKLLTAIDMKKYPTSTIKLIEEFRSKVAELPHQGKPLVRTQKTKSLRMLEPKIEAM